MRKIFNKNLRLYLLIILFFELLSFSVYWLRYVIDLNSLITVALILAIFILALSKLEYALYFAIAELIIGSKGHLFALTISNNVISIRIGIFAVIMLAFIITNFKRRHEICIWLRDYKILGWLGAACILGLVMTIIKKNSYGLIFNDLNAWLYFFYLLPFSTLLRAPDSWIKFWQISTASVIAIILKTFTFVFVFSHNLPIRRDFYKWGRDTGWGEFTLIGGNLYRIFSQAQIYVVFAFFICAALQIYFLDKNKRHYLNFILFFGNVLCLSVIIISMSRSFWLGIIITLFLSLIPLATIFRLKLQTYFICAIVFMMVVSASYGLFLTIVRLPILQYAPASSISLLSERFNLGDAASSSRWSQLPELIKKISLHPVLGNGWGTTVTYKSFDPRLMTINNPDGLYSTYAFEWGYLDILLKIGSIGLILYLIFLGDIFKNLYHVIKNKTDRFIGSLFLGLSLSLIALVVIHTMSPYLNHPLGIGFILLLIIMTNFMNTTREVMPAENPDAHLQNL